MHGAMGGGTNGAGHVNMGLPYKAYKAEQVSVMQMMVVGMHTEMAGYERVGMLMQGTAGAIEAAGMGPVMHLAIGDGNIRLPSVARPTNALVTPPAYDNSFTEVMIGPEGADTMVELSASSTGFSSRSLCGDTPVCQSRLATATAAWPPAAPRALLLASA